jgi:hypothetical protein
MLNSLEKRMLIYDVLDLFDGGGGEPRPPFFESATECMEKTSGKRKPYCLNERKTTAKVSYMFWRCITYTGIGSLVSSNGNLNSAKLYRLVKQSFVAR